MRVFVSTKTQIPVRIIDKVNHSTFGKLRVAVFLKQDDRGQLYFEVHTPKKSYTDVVRLTITVERAEMRPVCPSCGREDCEGMKLKQRLEEADFGNGIGIVSFSKLINEPGILEEFFKFFADVDQESATNDNGHASNGNGNGHASNGNGHAAKQPKKKARGKEQRAKAGRSQTPMGSRPRSPQPANR